MIDLHSHILPAMDDGSASAKESEELLKMLRKQGVTTVVATPHFYATKDDPQDFLRRRGQSFAKLRQTDSPRILLGAEVAYFDGMSHSAEMELLQLGQSGLLLVEMPFGAWSGRVVEEICGLQTSLGLRPVLAHVDRYLHKKQLLKYWEVLLDNDVCFQCNGDIFLRPWKRRWIMEQLDAGNIHFLGSDCHNLQTRLPRMHQAAAVITKKLGKAPLEQLEETGRKLLNLE